MFETLHHWMTVLLERLVAWGVWGLAVVASAEPSVLPLSPDLVLGTLVVGGRERGLPWLLTLAAVGSVCSFVGSLGGYWLGRSGGHALLKRFIPARGMATVERYFGRYGGRTIFVVGVSPLPYKWFTLSAGAFRANFPGFAVGCAASRTIRFFGLALLIHYLGDAWRTYVGRWTPAALGAIAVIAVTWWLIARRRATNGAPAEADAVPE